jgi:hypothetical protein
LAALVQQLPEWERAAVLKEAREAVPTGDVLGRAESLAALAHHLRDQAALRAALSAALALQDPDDKVRILSALIPSFPVAQQEEALGAAVKEACELTPSHRRAAALHSLTPHLARLPCLTLVGLWEASLPVLAQRPRRELLADLRAMVPVIRALGGQAALQEVFGAVRDVGRWWP